MRARVLAVAIVVVVVGGCWRGSGEPGTTATGPGTPIAAPPADAPCDVVAGNAHRMLAASADETLARRARAIAAAVMRRCSEDAWSLELRQCMVDAREMEDADRCEPLATDAQRDALDDAITVIENADP